ncbi:hypothetical protein BT69DRAFT_1288724 [Atractiella rhizophila]|nr:hypothetical protein BT69DRAFT_1288724 [Atractiella rhizophila]
MSAESDAELSHLSLYILCFFIPYWLLCERKRGIRKGYECLLWTSIVFSLDQFRWQCF